MHNSCPSRVAEMIAVVLSATTALSASTWPVSADDPLAIAKGAMAALKPKIDGFVKNSSGKHEAYNVEVRLWMHDGDEYLNGCGFYFQVNDVSGGRVGGHFPEVRKYICDFRRYSMRLTAPGASYGTALRMDDELAAVYGVEVHAGGRQNTFVEAACFGFDGRTATSGGARGLCINNDLLRACKRLYGEWNDVDLEWKGIPFGRSAGAVQQAVVFDVENLLGFARDYGRNPDDASALQSVCDRIDLTGGYEHNANTCPAIDSNNETADGNPYGCKLSVLQ